MRRDADPAFRQAWSTRCEDGRDQVRAMILRYSMGRKLQPGRPGTARADAGRGVQAVLPLRPA